MPTLEELRRAAYKTELVMSRRLTRNTGLPERDALIQILEQRTGLPLTQLLAIRVQAKADEVARKTHRQQRKDDVLAQKRTRALAEQTDAVSWLAWFDGSARPNPGRIGLGGILRQPDGTMFELCAAAGHGDSNQAEYLALIAILEMALQLKAMPLRIYGDSRVVIDRLRGDDGDGGTSTIFPAVLSTHHAKARTLLAQLPDVTLHWIPRQRNAAADALSQHACNT